MATNEPMSKSIHFFMGEQLYADIWDQADLLGMTVSEYLRKVVSDDIYSIERDSE